VLAFGRGQANLLGRWPIWPIGQGQRPKLAAKMLLAFGRGQANLLGRWPIWQRPNWPNRPSRPNRPKLANNLLTFYLKKLISVGPLDSFVARPLVTRSFSKSGEIMFERLMIQATVSAGFILQ